MKNRAMVDVRVSRPSFLGALESVAFMNWVIVPISWLFEEIPCLLSRWLLILFVEPRLSTESFSSHSVALPGTLLAWHMFQRTLSIETVLKYCQTQLFLGMALDVSGVKASISESGLDGRAGFDWDRILRHLQVMISLARVKTWQWPRKGKDPACIRRRSRICRIRAADELYPAPGGRIATLLGWVCLYARLIVRRLSRACIFTVPLYVVDTPTKHLKL